MEPRLGFLFVPSLQRNIELLKKLLSLLILCLFLSFTTRVVEAPFSTFTTYGRTEGEEGRGQGGGRKGESAKQQTENDPTTTTPTTEHHKLITMRIVLMLSCNVTKETVVNHGLQNLRIATTHPGEETSQERYSMIPQNTTSNRLESAQYSLYFVPL